LFGELRVACGLYVKPANSRQALTRQQSITHTRGL